MATMILQGVIPQYRIKL